MDKFGEIADSLHMELQPNPNMIFTGIITHPELLFHVDIYNVLEMYIPGLPSVKITLLDRKNDIGQLYHLTWLRKIPCLSNKSVLGKEPRKYEKLVLEKTKIQEHKMFFPAEHEGTEPIVSLDVAESILRRNSRGLNLVELEVV